MVHLLSCNQYKHWWFTFHFWVKWTILYWKKICHENCHWSDNFWMRILIKGSKLKYNRKMLDKRQRSGESVPFLYQGCLFFFSLKCAPLILRLRVCCPKEHFKFPLVEWLLPKSLHESVQTWYFMFTEF